MDPHKWWYMPYPCGAILTRDGEAGRRAFWSEAVYIPQTDDAVEFRDHGLAGSRPFSALKLWMGMKMVGRRAYGVMAEQQVELAERFVRELTSDGQWESVTPVDTAIAAVRWSGQLRDGQLRVGGEVDRKQDEIVSRVLAKRRWWISPTTTVGKRAIRVMVISYLTRWEHLRELIEELRKAARDL